jgi:hypothetical protein
MQYFTFGFILLKIFAILVLLFFVNKKIFKYINEVQPLNIYSISLTEQVLKWDKSKEIRFLQL